MNPLNLFILGTYKRSINRGRSEERAFWETEFQLTLLILMLVWPACLHYLLSFGRTTAIITLSCFSILVIHPLAKKLALSVLSNNKNMLYHKRIVAFSDCMYVIAGAIMLLQMWLYLAPWIDITKKSSSPAARAGTQTRRAASPLCPTCLRPLFKS